MRSIYHLLTTAGWTFKVLQYGDALVDAGTAARVPHESVQGLVGGTAHRGEERLQSTVAAVGSRHKDDDGATG